jgi:hypothetical protein
MGEKGFGMGQVSFTHGREMLRRVAQIYSNAEVLNM